MNVIDEIKLAIYESSLDDEDKAELVDIVESSEDNEEVLHEVVNILESVMTEAPDHVEADEEYEQVCEAVVEMIADGELTVEEAADILGNY